MAVKNLVIINIGFKVTEPLFMVYFFLHSFSEDSLPHIPSPALTMPLPELVCGSLISASWGPHFLLGRITTRAHADIFCYRQQQL